MGLVTQLQAHVSQLTAANEELQRQLAESQRGGKRQAAPLSKGRRSQQSQASRPQAWYGVVKLPQAALQFTRLNLGTIINSGEKLHAMVGDLRNECFDGMGKHSFLKGTSDIPTRRFAREQVAAQILAQIFSLHASGGFVRTRHFDLQGLFKRNSRLTSEQRELVERVTQLLDLVAEPFGEINISEKR